VAVKEVIRHAITDEQMRTAAAAITDEARENYGGVDVISVGISGEVRYVRQRASQ
jgi:hypothetical protein